MSARLSLENIEAERSVLGAVLKDPSVFWSERSHLRPILFADPFHRDVMKAIGTLADGGREFGIPALVSRLPVPEDGTSVAGRLAVLMADQAEVGLAHDLIEDLKNTWGRREMASLGERLIRYSTEPSDTPALERLEKAIGRAQAIGEAISDDPGGLAQAAREMLEDANTAHKRQRSNAIPWFLREAARATGDDIEYGWLIGLLVESGGGKTSLALQQTLFTAELGIPVLFLSGDQAPKECLRQMASQSLGIEARDIRSGRLSDHDFQTLIEETNRITSLPIEIRKMGLPTTAQIGSMVRSWRRRRARPGLWILDHVKRVRPNDQKANLDVTVNQICGDLKALAQQTDCPGLILQQRNSKGFDRENPRPTAQDVYGGLGAVENFDTIMGMYIEERWLKERLDQAKSDAQKESIEKKLRACEGQAELSGIKTRHGPQGRRETIKREARFTRFVSLLQEARDREPELPV